MIKSFKYRIYPGPGQRRKLEATLESCRWLYNFFLAERKYIWEGGQQFVTRVEQCNKILQIKNVRQDLCLVYSQVLQEITGRIDKAFKAFYRRLKSKELSGYPRFKGKGQYTSFTYPQSSNYGSPVQFKNNKLHLAKIGLIKIKLHRPLEGRPKTCSIHKTATGKWWVTFQCECEEPILLPKNDLKVGIDLGLKTFAHMTDGNKIESPRFFKQEKVSLAKAQRQLSKIDKRCNTYNKHRRIVSRVYERIKFKGDNFCHQESRKIINKYQIICIEDLSVRQIMRNKFSNKSLLRMILDTPWYTFTQMLEVKAAWAGRQVIKVNPAYTSQTCSSCGARKKLSLSDRVYKCSCGLDIDRDLNASKNILRLGLQSLGLSQDKAIEVH